MIDGKHAVVSVAGCERLETVRIPFAFLSTVHRGDGTNVIVAIPIN